MELRQLPGACRDFPPALARCAFLTLRLGSFTCVHLYRLFPASKEETVSLAEEKTSFLCSYLFSLVVPKMETYI